MKHLPVVLFALAFVLAACGGSPKPSSSAIEAVPAEFAGKTNPLGTEASVDGAALFQTSCEPCHGPRGYGDGPAGQALDPAPKNLADLQAKVGDDFLFWRISTGKPGTSMVAWQGILTEEQIWQLVAFIRSLK
jgi:mono/diheme cytochrome c family protein